MITETILFLLAKKIIGRYAPTYSHGVLVIVSVQQASPPSTIVFHDLSPRVQIFEVPVLQSARPDTESSWPYNLEK